MLGTRMRRAFQGRICEKSMVVRIAVFFNGGLVVEVMGGFGAQSPPLDLSPA